MSESGGIHNRVKARRQAMGWSQEELARKAGVSRAAVSAIEVERLVPSVAAALSLAAAFKCSVEELFGSTGGEADSEPRWAWGPKGKTRFWRASVAGRVWLYPVEPTSVGMIGHDGLFDGERIRTDTESPADSTLIIATCDPAAGLLASEYARATGFRLIPLVRSSSEAIELLKRGLVHAAGAHFATEGDESGNAKAIQKRISSAVGLVSVARWEESLALGSAVTSKSISSILKAELEWVGREAGSAARLRLDELRAGAEQPRQQAFDHRGVAEAIRCGWADAGLCLRLAAEEAGLRVIGLRYETYQICFEKDYESDPRIQGLIRVIRSNAYRRLLGELPGYDPSVTGELQHLSETSNPQNTGP